MYRCQETRAFAGPTRQRIPRGLAGVVEATGIRHRYIQFSYRGGIPIASKDLPILPSARPRSTLFSAHPD